MVSVSQMQQGTGRGEGGAFTLLDSERAVCRPASLTPQPQCVFLQILWLSAFGAVGLLRAGKGKWQVPGSGLGHLHPPGPPRGGLALPSPRLMRKLRPQARRRPSPALPVLRSPRHPTLSPPLLCTDTGTGVGLTAA